MFFLIHEKRDFDKREKFAIKKDIFAMIFKNTPLKTIATHACGHSLSLRQAQRVMEICHAPHGPRPARAGATKISPERCRQAAQ